MRMNRSKMLKKVVITGLSLMLLSTSFPTNWSKPNNKIIPSKLQNIEVKALASDSTQLTGGLGYTVILKDNGTVWTFGLNDKYQLGLQDTIDRFNPTRIDPAHFNNEKVVEVKANTVSVLAKTETNKMYYWGNGTKKPTLIYNNLPVNDFVSQGYTGVDNLTSLHLVTNDGRLHSSGTNVRGSFSIGTSGWRSALGNCLLQTDVSLSDFSTVALKNFSLESCPTNTSWKRIVDGTATPMTDVVEIASGESNFQLLSRTITNELYLWGTGIIVPRQLPNSINYAIKKIQLTEVPFFLTEDGKLYYYPDTSQHPVEITLETSSSPIVDIAGFNNSLLILTEEGKLFGIGANKFGNLGSIISANGIPYSSRVAAYTGINNVKKIGSGYEHSILQYNDGRYSTLGRNSYGELSTMDVNSKTTFVKNANLTSVTDIVSMNYSSFATTADSKFYSWGGRSGNEILNRVGNSNTPMVVRDFSSISPIKYINGFTSRTIDGGVLLQNGQFYTYGDNWKKGTGISSGGHVLNNPLTNSNTNLPGSNFTLVEAAQGSTHGVGISSDNKLYTWGYDGYNNLGLGYDYMELDGGIMATGGLYAFQSPVTPSGETFVKAFAGMGESFVLTTEGKVYAWGYNAYNRLGLSQNTKVPTLVTSLPPIKDIAIGVYHNLFLDFQGNVWAAGANNYGQLGIGNTTSPSVPTKISTLSNVKAIGAGDYTGFAILSNGDLYSFGDNRNGQLGLGDSTQRNEPRKVPGVVNAKKVDGALKHTLVITDLGDLFVSGSDSDGQLGLSQVQFNPEPVIVVYPPAVSIFNQNNQIYTLGDTVQVNGSIFTETQGVPMTITYQIESQNGTVEKTLKTYTTGSTAEPFTISIPIDASYSLGAYTLTVTAQTNSGVSGKEALNFSVQDKVKPTLSIDVSSASKWSLAPVSVNVSADDTGGSGYRGFRYAVTNSNSLPSSWTTFNPSKSGTISVNTSGTNYLHIEAYDNIGNVQYLQSGPYYVDVDPPSFSFNEPGKWQQNRLDLGVSIQEASNIITKKWLPGLSTIDEIKISGNDLVGSTIPITNNGIYSFYAKDENNQESLQTFTVSNVNYTPTLLTAPTKLLIPSNVKSSYVTTASFSHTDSADPIQLVADLNGTIITSSTTNSTSSTDLSINWNSDFSSITENNLYNGQLYLKDSRSGISNKQNIQLEVYNPNLTIKSKMTGMNISWTHSSLSPDYRLLKDGEVIYSGTNNTYFDNTTDTTNNHIYELQVFINGNYITVGSNNKNDGYNLLETPSSILFSDTTIGNQVTPTTMDLEYMKYQDFSDLNTACTISVSITDFHSNQSSFTPDSFVLKNVKKLNRNNQIEKTFFDIYLTSTPVQIVNQSDTLSDSYVKLEMLKENISLSIPKDVKLNSNGSEDFQAEVIWEVTLAP
ncbi:hypothetical protein MZM54_02700 [[Brevibacterium] frigoritolerans]|nr:hypothetical protein [Peribacillus frigoritolerans]